MLREPAGTADTMPRSPMAATPPPDPPPEAAPAGDPAPAAVEAAAPEAAPKRRWLPRRRPSAAPAEGAPADGPAPEASAAEPVTEAISEATTPAPPKPDGPRQLRRNRKKILSQREVAVYDLGGLAFELYRRDMLGEEVMVRRAQEVAELDDTVRDIDVRLGEIERERRARRERTPADPSVGCCLACRAPFRAEARFCWQCGAEVVPPVAGDEQPTVVIPTPPSV